jgi:hypothetical protein
MQSPEIRAVTLHVTCYHTDQLRVFSVLSGPGMPRGLVQPLKQRAFVLPHTLTMAKPALCSHSQCGLCTGFV